MATTINYNTNVIFIPTADLVLIGGSFYKIDTEAWRLEVSAIQASEEGISFPDAIVHFTTYTIAGIEYARAFRVIPPYTVEFEDGQLSVRLDGSNNNLFEQGVRVQNQVSIIPTNSAGLIVAQDAAAATAAAVWAAQTSDETGAGTRGLEATESHQASDQGATQRYTQP